MKTIIEPSTHIAVFPVLLVALMSLPLVFFYRSYLRISMAAAFGILLGAIGLGILAARQHLEVAGPALQHRDPIDRTLVPIACFLFVLVVVPLIVRLVRAWLFDDLTDAERRPDAEGMRAWLRGGNLVCAVAIPALGWYGYDYSAWALLVVVLLALIVRPLLASTVPNGGEGPTENDVLRSDHDRIMRMLESGKIRADEASDLLSALGTAAPAALASPPRPPLTFSQKLAFGGSLLLVFGFVLPWFTINPGKEMNRLSSELNVQLNSQMGSVSTDIFGRAVQGSRMGSLGNAFPQMTTGSLSFSGADVNKGLGWVILICGLAATFLIARPDALNDRSLRRVITMGAVALGAALLLYMLGSNFRYASYGMLLVAVGYICIAQGAFRRDGSR